MTFVKMAQEFTSAHCPHPLHDDDQKHIVLLGSHLYNVSKNEQGESHMLNFTVTEMCI